MRGKRAKELREMAGFSVSYNSETKKLKEYVSAKSRYKSLKKTYKEI
tara:strand:+ start:3426 stop:3566 length:141 start_codon:yes stop_codon:yes gene_type:complete